MEPGQHPTTVRVADEFASPREHCVRHVLGYNSRRTRKAADVANEIDDISGTRRQVVQRAGSEQRVFGLGVNSARQIHGSSRVIGQVMQ